MAAFMNSCVFSFYWVFPIQFTIPHRKRIALYSVIKNNNKKCELSQVQKKCNYKVKLGEETQWYAISQHCRNRITAVCDFFTYVRYIQQGLVKSEDKDVFYEIVKLRKQMALARLGYV